VRSRRPRHAWATSRLEGHCRAQRAPSQAHLAVRLTPGTSSVKASEVVTCALCLGRCALRPYGRAGDLRAACFGACRPVAASDAMRRVRCKLCWRMRRYAWRVAAAGESGQARVRHVSEGGTFEQSPPKPSVVVRPCGAEVDSSEPVLQLALSQLKDGPSQAIGVVHINQISEKLTHVLGRRQRGRWRLHPSQCMTKLIYIACCEPSMG